MRYYVTVICSTSLVYLVYLDAGLSGKKMDDSEAVGASTTRKPSVSTFGVTGSSGAGGTGGTSGAGGAAGASGTSDRPLPGDVRGSMVESLQRAIQERQTLTEVEASTSGAHESDDDADWE